MPAFGATPLSVSTSVSNRFLYFADGTTVRVTVVTDSRQADPASVRFTPNFGVWDQLSPTRTTSSTAGPFTRRTWSYDIACLQTSCLPQRKPLAMHLPPLTVSVKRRDGSTVSVQRRWPALSIAPRFGPAPRGAIPSFALDAELPTPTYRVGPTRFALGLDVLAALLAGFGLWIVAREVLRRRPARAAPELPPLARALMVLRQAKTRPTDDRRRAAGLLARTLVATDRDSDLSATASRVAWAAPEPAPGSLEELAESVEAEQRAAS
jgi:hypothetical protein